MATTDGAREALDTLHARVGQVTTSAEWTAWLDVLAKFHDYSPRNTAWLWIQWQERRAVQQVMVAMTGGAIASLPDCERFAAFSTWGDLGRPIVKGEKGLTVLCPIIVKDRENVGKDGKPREKLVGWRTKSRTFEVAQTHGADLPSNPAAATLLTGDSDPAAWRAMQDHAESLGFSVTITDDCLPANGDCNPATKALRVAASLDPAQQFKTLTHEVAHATLHGTDSELSRAEKEVEAESVAYVVAAMLGFDTAAYSVGYVTTWASRENHGALLVKTAERVVKAAQGIVKEVAASMLTLAA